MKKTKEQNLKHKIPNTNSGITLIALVITIIVMLILVAVTITMAVNGGLFNYAGKAVTQTNEAIKAEQQLASGRVKIENTWYDSIDDYIAQKPSTNQGEVAEEPETITQTLILTGEAEVDVKSTITLVAKLNDEEVTASSIEWTSSNTDAATVENGIVTGVNSKKGTTTITATYNNSVIATKEIIVNPKYLGHCGNCTEGIIEGFICPVCEGVNSYYKDIQFYAECLHCEKLVKAKQEDNLLLRCVECGEYIVDESWIEYQYFELMPCGHIINKNDVGTQGDIYSLFDTKDCPDCIDGSIYDEGD